MVTIIDNYYAAKYPSQFHQSQKCTDSVVECEKQVDNNDLYEEELVLDSKCRSYTNQSYRQKHRVYRRQRYSSDIQFRDRIKSSRRNKYKEDASYRDKKRLNISNRYKCNSQHRKQLKLVGLNRYRNDIAYRKYKRMAFVTRYRTNIQYRHTLKTASIHKYRSNIQHKQQVKDANAKKYRKCASYRQKNKDRLCRQYMEESSVRIKKIQNVNTRRRQKRKDSSDTVQFFRQEVKNGPQHICCVCHKFHFRKQVLVCQDKNYNKKGRKQQMMAKRCISYKYSNNCTDQCEDNCELLNHNKLWICHTCHRHLLKGEMPAEAVSNNLDLQPIPDSLKNLNSLEKQLLSLRIPFIKLVRLPKGGQKGVIGPCVSVPTDVQKTTSILPRSDGDELVRVKLKRKRQYKGYHQYEYVSTSKLHKGLKYLQENNHWYSSVSLDPSWENPIAEEIPDSTDKTHISDEQHPDTLHIDEDRFPQTVNETNADSNDDEEDTNLELKGMAVDTCLQPADIGQEVLDQYFDEIFCIAPGEGYTPVSMLREEGNEAMTFCVQYPDGSGTYDDDRPVSLTRSRYFHARLLNADNRFASDSNYLFYAQYLSELEKVISQVSIALRKGTTTDHTGNALTADMLSDPSSLKKLLKTDQGYKFLTPIRGTPPYWQATLKDLFAMIRQLGIPTWFCTFSAADMRWIEVLEVLMKQQGSEQSPDDLDWAEKCEVLRNNSITNAIMFNHRFHTFLKEIIIRREVIGKIKDHFHRIEFQLRGSPHSHCLFWVDGAPLLDEDDDRTVCSFIDKYVTCKLPDEHDNQELHEIVSSVQQHSKGHSKSCRKKGTTCRFNFPRPPSERTFISRPQSLTDPSIESTPEQMVNKAKDILKAVWDVINNTDLEEITTQNIFTAAGITQEDFEEASNILTKRTSVVLERAPTDVWINQYNPTLLQCWNANMDIQYVSDAYSCVMYIISYISKAEREMGMILEDAKKEAAEGNLDAAQTMKTVGGAYFRQREVSAQEAAYRVCGLHLKEASRKVQFIPVGDNPIRMSLPLNVIKQKSGTLDDEEVWMPTLSERYRARPVNQHFDKMCLATFASEYRISAKSQIPKDTSTTPHVHQLQNNLGFIQKRSRTDAAVVRYPRFSVKKNAELYYQSILQLFLPHRSVQQLKPSSFENYEDFYSTGAVKLTSSSPPTSVKTIVESNRQLYEKNSDALDDAQELMEKSGALEDAWAMISPELEADRLECQMDKPVETSNDDQHIEIPDLDLSHNKQNKDEIMHIRTNIPTTEEIMPLIQSLNKTQKQVFYTVRQWCLDKVNGKHPTPFNLFITGGAGTGKSHLIKCLAYQAHKILAPHSSNPDDITVLLTAPTGTAAFNIGGTTLHQAFSLPQFMSLPYQHLRDEKLNTLRSKLENLKILVIDEISMVGQEVLLYVNERLRQIKQSKNALFGNLCVIAVGDFYQLPAVKQKCLYDLRPKNYFPLWSDTFSVVQLQDIMRQRDDAPFAELLNRLRVKTKEDVLSADDAACLEACQNNTADPEALHIFPTNAEVDQHNNTMITKVCDAFSCMFAEDFDKNPQNGRLTRREMPYETSADYLPSSIDLGRGARVMVIRNVDVADGLVNGVIGTVENILPPLPGSSLSSGVEITFDNKKVGLNQKHTSQKNVVLVKPVEETLKNNAIRHQFPLRLAWGCTVHKVQGITTDKAVVSLKKIFNAGMAYVGLSRVTSIQGLTIQDFDADKIYCSKQITEALQRMPPFFSTPEFHTQTTDTLNIILHNIQGLTAHIKDMRANTDLTDSDFICLTETWMEHTTIKPVFNNYEFHHKPRSESYTSTLPVFDSLKKQKHGGVGVFTANNQRFHEIPLMACDIEGIAFHIQNFNVTVAVIYRPDSYTPSVFIHNLDRLLKQLPHKSATTLIIGDFNQNLFKSRSSVKDFMDSRGYQQLVSKPTTDGATLIDHVYVRGNSSAVVDVFPTYYSYHDIVSINLCSKQ